MNPEPANVRRLFIVLVLWALAGLFLLPGLAYWFTGHVQADYSAQFQHTLLAQVEASDALNGTEKASARSEIEGSNVHSLCAGAYVQMEPMRLALCGNTEPLGQMYMARKISKVTLGVGVLTLLLIAGLSALAYFRPRHQVLAFASGWWALRLVSATEVIIQGALLIWLSYWITAYFFDVYILKLILFAGLFAGVAMFIAVAAIFSRAPMQNAVNGELITVERAPELWTHVRKSAAELGTEPPSHIIGGIDTNFFVTQAPVQIGEQELHGRTLFVSLPLLSALARDEADAVLAHELAHFSGGDTHASAQLGPRLNAYAHYMEALGQSGFAIIAFHVLNLFSAAFELARSRESRHREFTADQVAARMTSAQAISRALIRIGAYARYRDSVEEALFSQRQRHQGPLQVADRVAQGLSAFAQSEGFRAAMTFADVPHPFDSHPPLQQRMENVGAVIAMQDFSAIVATPPAETWIDFIHDAASIESRLWQGFEAQFAEQHELSLAYRLGPANEAEREIVLKYFPDIEFALAKHAVVRLSHVAIHAPEQEVAWSAVSGMEYKDGSFGTGDVLVVTHPDKGVLGTSRTSKIKLAIQSADRDRFKAELQRYWQRDQIMRQSLTAPD